MIEEKKLLEANLKSKKGRNKFGKESEKKIMQLKLPCIRFLNCIYYFTVHI
jgi:hypothetical protein